MTFKKIITTSLLSFAVTTYSTNVNAQQEKTMELSTKEQSIVLISSDTALGDVEQLKIDLETALNEKVLTVNEIKEILVHLYAYCGFPRSLNAINKFLEIMNSREAQGIKDEQGATGKVLASDVDKNKFGGDLRAKLVKSDKTAPYAEFVPTIDDYLKEHLFADIFAREVLSYQERETTTIAALSSLDGVEAQLNAL